MSSKNDPAGKAEERAGSASGEAPASPPEQTSSVPAWKILVALVIVVVLMVVGGFLLRD